MKNSYKNIMLKENQIETLAIIIRDYIDSNPVEYINDALDLLNDIQSQIK